jgi:hypothetical protein
MLLYSKEYAFQILLLLIPAVAVIASSTWLCFYQVEYIWASTTSGYIIQASGKLVLTPGDFATHGTMSLLGTAPPENTPR